MVDVYELCRKLKPIIGQQADRMWKAYLAEDADGKKELTDTIQLMAIELLGDEFDDAKVHLSTPSKEVARGEYPIGTITYAGKSLYPFGIRESEWLQHISIFGRSGAGKTNTVFLLVEHLTNHNKPFLIFDWKRNYRDMLADHDKKTLVYTVGSATSPFAFNPLIPPNGVPADIWLKKLIEIIAHAYYLGEGVMYLLQEAIDAVYREYGVYQNNVKTYPTFLDVLNWLENHPAKGRKSQWMDSTLRGIKSICFGSMGRVMNISVQSNLEKLLDQNVILELDQLTNADKTLIVESMLLWIHHYRLSEPQRELFKHALILEEAHHILARKAGSHHESIIETVFREIRELGESIILLDQHPNMISPVALGNTYTTICLNLKHKSDVNAMGSAMLLDTDERNILGTLPVGSAVVKLQGRILKPFQITIPYQKINKGEITDEHLARLMEERKAAELLGIDKTTGVSGNEQEPIILSENEETLLLDILTHPYSGVVERYRRLHLSRRKGNTIKEKCMEKGLIDDIPIPTRTGKVIVLRLNELSKKLLRDKGYQFTEKNHKESFIHEYWKHKTADYYESLGYEVTIEKPINGFTDLLVEKEGNKMAVEIETGKSDLQKNIQRNLARGFQTLVVFATNDKTFDKIREYIIKKQLNFYVELYQAQDIL